MSYPRHKVIRLHPKSQLSYLIDSSYNVPHEQLCNNMLEAHENSPMHSSSPGSPQLEASLGSPKKRTVCPVCNKLFLRQSELDIHYRSHTGEKPFKCTIEGCTKRFSVNSNRRRHERKVHTKQNTGGGPRKGE
jgi:uncharacterized Zn-finger protein